MTHPAGAGKPDSSLPIRTGAPVTMARFTRAAGPGAGQHLAYQVSVGPAALARDHIS
jgi:hypothetical protein